MTYLATRMLSALTTVAGVSVMVFFFIHLIPGDPVERMLGDNARPADRTVLRQALGLDQTLPRQLASYAGGLVRLDLGNSLVNDRPVGDLLIERVPATAELAVAALVLALVIALPLGVAAARRHRSWRDTTAMGFSLVGVSIPNFWLGPLLILLFS